MTNKKIDELYRQLNDEAEAFGYHLNPDISFTKDLAQGLITNTERYGYQSCPCRLAAGKREEDLDLICPCDYRDPDLNQYGACFCGLYVSKEIVSGIKKLKPVPERRLPKEVREKMKSHFASPSAGSAGDKEKYFKCRLPKPVWRCRVCGYLMSADSPPETCPICKADQDRFERFA